MVLKRLARSAYYWLMERIRFLRFCLSRKPSVMSDLETVEHVLRLKCSIARFGDGEFSLMADDFGGIHFQRCSPLLKEELIGSFSSRDPRILICVTDAFWPRKYKRKPMRYYLRFFSYNYPSIRHIIDYSYTYGNACFTRFFVDYRPTRGRIKATERLVASIRSIFVGRNLLIVEGAHTQFGQGNDLIDGAVSVRRILCPDRDAYAVADTITNSVVRYYHKDDLVLMALGPTASVLCVRLTLQYNMQCLDIGHLDIEYLWYLNNASSKTLIEGKNSAEAENGMIRVNNSRDIEKEVVFDCSR